MGIHFVNISEKEFLKLKFLYKIMPLEYALAFFETGGFWFAKPTVWEDPYEKRFIDATYNGKKFIWKDRVFCTCMTGIHSSEALWNMYSKNSIAVQFCLRREDLLYILNDYVKDNPTHEIYIGRVEYLNTNEINMPLKQIPFSVPSPSINPNNSKLAAKLLLLKRIAYEYEKEIRIMIVKPMSTSENGISVPYDKNNLNFIERITLDPKISRYEEIAFKKVFNYFLHNNTTRSKVFKSSLYKQKKTVHYITK